MKITVISPYVATINIHPETSKIDRVEIYFHHFDDHRFFVSPVYHSLMDALHYIQTYDEIPF